ncbi:MAG TPA: M50 family metallopeptidase, partial [Pilimelia sp.]|nr:M50 family metallopeptidase [Pilimelia sp.]
MSVALLAAPAAEQSPEELAWTAAVVAWIAAVPLFFVTKFVTVIAHEGGHALVAKLLFQKLESI